MKRYGYSEPAYGKDVCDRILCPRKSSINCYCHEGHDMNCAANMRIALKRPVQGVSAPVCVVDEKKNNLTVNKIDGFSKLHNFTHDDKCLLVRRACDIRPGKLIPFDDVVVKSSKRQPGLLFRRMQLFTMRNARQISDTEEPTDEGHQQNWTPKGPR